MPAGLDAVTGRLHHGQPHQRLADEPRQEPDRVGAATDTGDGEVGQPPLGGHIIWAAASSPIRRWRSRTMVGYGCGPSIADPRT